MLFQKINLRLSARTLNIYLRKCYSTIDKAVLNVPSVTKKIDSYSNIEILSSKHSLLIKTYDLLDCQDANLLRFSLKSKNPDKVLSETELEQSLDRAIKINDKTVSINTKDLKINQENRAESEEVLYLFEVPIRANLKIDSEQSVTIENLYGDKIAVHTTGEGGDIKTKNLQAVELDFDADNGNILCDGTTLARETSVRVKKSNVSTAHIE